MHIPDRAQEPRKRNNILGPSPTYPNTQSNLLRPGHAPQIPKTQHIPNPLRPRKQHAQSINPTPPPARRWQPPLQRLQVILIHFPLRLHRRDLKPKLDLKLPPLLKR
ncbi:hypothetical protein I7I53_05293 [Histoplasma capsulatum var. duboisii H88]|uniref:Uncharacterized protein n=1 Tax=Ajellomyces capsulatus (strain H88) TaxID=544711 RepID=A0A8A1LXN9_AJEC8|nr:hypothetical protein I7I53_05293 [Histoplasma capsulatum var. duboisii H88]